MMYHRKLTVSVSSHFVHSLSFLQYEGNIVRVNMSRVIKEETCRIERWRETKVGKSVQVS